MEQLTEHLTVLQARKRRDWSQTELANRTRLNKSAISRLEAGKVPNPSSRTVKVLEETLEVPRGTLIFGIPPDDSAEVSTR